MLGHRIYYRLKSLIPCWLWRWKLLPTVGVNAILWQFFGSLQEHLRWLCVWLSTREIASLSFRLWLVVTGSPNLDSPNWLDGPQKTRFSVAGIESDRLLEEAPRTDPEFLSNPLVKSLYDDRSDQVTFMGSSGDLLGRLAPVRSVRSATIWQCSVFLSFLGSVPPDRTRHLHHTT